jgi:RNA ligase
MFSYGIEADFRIEVVRECRGIILDETDGYQPVCVPFFKFGNDGESYADDIDWTTARVQEKIDGSLIKVWCHKGAWRVSTNNTINAENAKTNNNEDTFRNIFDKAWALTGKEFGELNPDDTYMFELVSPQTRVVVPYLETKL